MLVLSLSLRNLDDKWHNAPYILSLNSKPTPKYRNYFLFDSEICSTLVLIIEFQKLIEKIRKMRKELNISHSLVINNKESGSVQATTTKKLNV